MYRTRQIIGLLTLLLASVGPLPLWLHRIQCHSLHCHGEHGEVAHGHVHGHTAQGHASRESVAHASCSHMAVDGKQTGDFSADANLPPASGELHTVHEHDCLVCFQLTQATVFTLAAVGAQTEPVCNDGISSDQHVCSSWSLGLYGSRAPPMS